MSGTDMIVGSGYFYAIVVIKIDGFGHCGSSNINGIIELRKREKSFFDDIGQRARNI